MKMKSTTNQLLRRNKSILKRNLLQKLLKKNLGTNKVESIAETLVKDTGKDGKEKEEKKRNFVRAIMNLKVKDAEESANVEDYKYHRSKRNLNNDINENTFRKFRQFYTTVAEDEWKKEKKKLDSKLKHLEQKHKTKGEADDTVRNIKVSDKALGPEKPLPEPAVYNVEKETISENVNKVLKLHPKLAVANPIKMVEVKTEIQKCFYKQRLSMKNQEERILMDETEEEAEEKERKSHELVDVDTNTINFNKLRPTDIPTNKTVGVPPLATNEVEIQMAATEAELVQVTKEYLERECNSKGFPKESNLTKEEQEGIKELKVMTKNDKIVTKTDKSEKLSLNTMQSYKEMGEPHVKDDKVLDPKILPKLERQLNGHTYQLCRILGVGTAWDDGVRIKSAMTNKSLPPPCLRLCTKDHKAIQPGQTLLPSRGICGASQSPNGQASHLISLILNEVAREYDTGTECVSTEDMIASMEEVNKKGDITSLFVGSMDVKGLYPNLKAKQTADIVTKVFAEVDIKVEGVSWAEAGKYLAINLDRETINNLGIGDLVSTRINRGGQHPGITTAEVMGTLYKEEGEEGSRSLFHPPRRAPTEQEEKVVLAQVLHIAIMAVLTTHSYQWNSEVRLQDEGAPIGLELAGALARVAMLWWDKHFLKLIHSNAITLYLYKRYIDDQNMAGKPLPPGTRWQAGPWASRLGKMVVVEEEVEEDKLVPADMRTMVELRKMADSIHPMIQLEEDYPSQHPDQKIPILDLKVWVKEEQEQEGRERKVELFYEYYRKPMSNWLLIPANSALSAATKRTALTQYGLRILRNTKPEVGWRQRADMPSVFMERMRDSGYGERFRMETIQSILKGWDRMVEEQRSGGRPINRLRTYQERESRWKKKGNWFKAGGYSSVMFCPWTPNGELAKRWREVEERGAANRGWRYRVVELGGRPLSSILCTNPWAGPCQATDCLICTTGGKGNCSRPGCTYAIKCVTCEVRGPHTVPQEEEESGERRPGQGQVGVPCLSLYHGQSGYSGYERGKDHQDDKKRKDKSNACVRHSNLYHDQGKEEVEFSMSVVSTTTTPYIRLIREGVEIVAGNQDILMNSKEEFLQGAVPNTRVQRGFGR